MTPAERARLIEKQEFEAESQAARKRAQLLVEQRRREDEARVDAWIYGRQTPALNPNGPEVWSGTRYTYNGETKALHEWAKQCRVSVRTMKQRVKLYGLDRAINFKGAGRVAPVHTINGVSKTLADWAKHIGVSYDALMQRIHKGRTLAEALAMPKGSGSYRKRAGVVADFPPFEGTGAGSIAQEIPEITFPKQADNE